MEGFGGGLAMKIEFTVKEGHKESRDVYNFFIKVLVRKNEPKEQKK